MDLKESGISPAYSVALPLCQTAVTIPPSRPTFVDLHVSQFGWSAVSPSRPAISQSVGRSGGQGKRAAARSHAQPPLCGEHGEHGEHWTLMGRCDQRLIRLGASELPLPLPTIPTARREAEAGSPSKSVTTTPSIAVILLIDTNRYSVPERFVGQSVAVYRLPAEIHVCRKDITIAVHRRLIGERDARSTLPDHHFIPVRQNRGTGREETLLSGHHPSLDRYAAALKQRSNGWGRRALRRLIGLKRTYP